MQHASMRAGLGTRGHTVIPRAPFSAARSFAQARPCSINALSNRSNCAHDAHSPQGGQIQQWEASKLQSTTVQQQQPGNAASGRRAVLFAAVLGLTQLASSSHQSAFAGSDAAPSASSSAPSASSPAPATSSPSLSPPANGSSSSAPLPAPAAPATPAPLVEPGLTDEASRRYLAEEDERRRRRKTSQGRIRELEEIRMELAEKQLALLAKEKELLEKEQTVAVLKEELEVERKLRALLTREKERAEEEAALAMGLCTGGLMFP